MRYLADKLSFRSERDENALSEAKILPSNYHHFPELFRDNFGASCEVIFASYTVYIVIYCETVKDSENERVQCAKITLNLFYFYFFDNIVIAWGIKIPVSAVGAIITVVLILILPLVPPLRWMRLFKELLIFRAINRGKKLINRSLSSPSPKSS